MIKLEYLCNFHPTYCYHKYRLIYKKYLLNKQTCKNEEMGKK